MCNTWSHSAGCNFQYFLAPLISYVTVSLGLCNPARTKLIATGDYSYSIYLYAYPIQQAVAAAGITNWWIHLAVSLVLVSVFAVISWHTIEKPAQ